MNQESSSSGPVPEATPATGTMNLPTDSSTDGLANSPKAAGAQESIATAEQLYGWTHAGTIQRPALEAGLRFLGHTPSRKEWLHFINTALLVLGAGFLVAGIFFFFAYNWDDLHRFVKLGLVQGAILAAVGMAHYLGLNKLSGKISLTVAALLVGALLGLGGQIYQSIADAYTLFLYWAIYIALWVIIGRFAPLWLLLIGLINLTVFLFWSQSSIPYDSRYEAQSIFLINALALMGWEWFRSRDVPWMQVRWWPRAVAAVALFAITIPAVEYVLEVYLNELAIQHWTVIILYLVFIGTIWLYYRYRFRDLLILTMMCLSLIAVGTACVARLINWWDILEFFVLALVVVAQAGLAAMWLRSLGEEL